MNVRCPECLKARKPADGEWTVWITGLHFAWRGSISAVVDAAPHYLTACGLSLGAP